MTLTAGQSMGKPDKEKLCPRCSSFGRTHQNRAEPAHTCPYAKDVYNDDKHQCVCCPACKMECLYDI